MGTVVKIDCRQSTYSVICYLFSEILLFTSPDFISFCVIPALFSSPAIPSICKILKLCPFGILSINFINNRMTWTGSRKPAGYAPPPPAEATGLGCLSASINGTMNRDALRGWSRRHWTQRPAHAAGHGSRRVSAECDPYTVGCGHLTHHTLAPFMLFTSGGPTTVTRNLFRGGGGVFPRPFHSFFYPPFPFVKKRSPQIL